MRRTSQEDNPRNGRAAPRYLRLAVALALAVAALFAVSAGRAPLAGATTFVPYQFIAKDYTEGLGRAPDQSGWDTEVSYFESNGCSSSTLSHQLNRVLESSEFNSLGYANPQLVEVAYRTVLNREPDSGGYASWLGNLNGGMSWPTLLSDFEASSEFATLANTICGSTEYGFGDDPAIALSPGSSGYSGDEAGLQTLLNDATSGSTVYLAPGAMIPLTSQLTIPSGVTLTTEGAPAAQAYAAMGRLARQPGWTGESVALDAGSTVTRVWIDGDRTVESSYDRTRFNIKILGGATTLSYSRIGNPAGATNIELDGAASGYTSCSAVVENNLFDAYSSQHGSGLWSDGISDGCEDSTITKNAVVDASDVAIILFSGGSSSITQQSQVTDNTVIQSGHGAFALLGLDPTTGQPNGATRSFSGANISDNTIWSAPTAISTFGITVGTFAWFGGSASIGNPGGAVSDNTSGDESVYAETGIDVSGDLNTTVSGNTLNYVQSTDPRSSCPQYAVGASVSAGYASGTIQSYTDATYASCVGTG